MTPEILTFEQYASRHGLSRQNIGEAALHRSSNTKSANSHKKDVELQAERDRKLINQRDFLHQEFTAKIAIGELREPTREESIIQNANGHEDKESTWAARRIAEKNGWDWAKGFSDV